MSRSHILLAFILHVIIGGVVLAVILLPTADTIDEPISSPSKQDSIRFEHGFVIVQQTLALPSRAPNSVALRLWVQHYPSTFPYLTVQGVAGEKWFGPLAVEIPPVDGTFHPIQLPVWNLPPNEKNLSISLRGHGVLLQTMENNLSAEENLLVNGIVHEHNSLVTQFVSYVGGIDKYIPLHGIAHGKASGAAGPKLFMVLMTLYIASFTLLMAVKLRLLKIAEGAYQAGNK